MLIPRQCRNYACCGLDISDLHALLEHFEDAHVLVFDEMAQGLQPLSVVLPPPPPHSMFASASSASASNTASPAESASTTSTSQSAMEGAESPESMGMGDEGVTQQGARHLSAPTTPLRTSSDSALAGALGESGSGASRQQQRASTSPMPSPLRTSFAVSCNPSSSSSSSNTSSTSSSSMSQQQQQQQQHTLQQQMMQHHLQQQRQLQLQQQSSQNMQSQHQHQPDDMDIGMELDFDLDYDVSMSEMAESSASAHSSPSSSNGSSGGSPQEQALHSFNNGTMSAMHQQSQLYRNGLGVPASTTASALSSPPDTPLLATPVSPFNNSSSIASSSSSSNANSSNTLFNNANGSIGVWGADGSLNPAGVQMQQQLGLSGLGLGGLGLGGMGGGMQSLSQMQAQMQQIGQQSQMQQGQMQGQAKGPSAFDAIHLHLPPKGGRGVAYHPNAFLQGQLMQQQSQLQSQMFSSAQQQQQQLNQQGSHHPQSLAGHQLAARGLFHSRVNGIGNGNGNGLQHPALNAHGAYATSEYARALSAMNGASNGGYGGGVKQEKLAMAIPPSLLLGNGGQGSMTSAWNTPMTTPAQSRSGSPTSSGSNSGVTVKKESSSSKSNGLSLNAHASSSSNLASGSGSTSNSNANSGASGSGSGTSTPLLCNPPLLLQKPFKCPKPGCMKSYKQANGLKYHLTHGQCLFTPSAELLALSEEGLSEREAERKLRPFCCQVAPCQRRYKNMNGLREWLSFV